MGALSQKLCLGGCTIKLWGGEKYRYPGIIGYYSCIQ